MLTWTQGHKRPSKQISARKLLVRYGKKVDVGNFPLRPRNDFRTNPSLPSLTKIIIKLRQGPLRPSSTNVTQQREDVIRLDH